MYPILLTSQCLHICPSPLQNSPSKENPAKLINHMPTFDQCDHRSSFAHRHQHGLILMALGSSRSHKHQLDPGCCREMEPDITLDSSPDLGNHGPMWQHKPLRSHGPYGRTGPRHQHNHRLWSVLRHPCGLWWQHGLCTPT